MPAEIKTVSISDILYPEPLRTIKDAPQFFYYLGELKPDENCFAVVGTRMCSPYGKEVALEIAGDLSRTGLTLVSGLAPGIDTFVHQAVVERGGRTIAVLGTGLDETSIYPQTNLGLARKILETGGALISEYPAGSHGSKITFPARNRIISGLSSGVLVIEAKERSGSLITARWARKQGRKVFAVPGPIHSLNSKGCHYLIKHGAQLVESADDVLRELNIAGSKQKNEPILGNTTEENSILAALKENTLDIDKIIETTGLPADKITSALSILEIEGKVKNLGGNIWAMKFSH
jgi:DNA processing protein